MYAVMNMFDVTWICVVYIVQFECRWCRGLVSAEFQR